VVCYSQTTCVAVLIPVVGGLIQPIWALVLQIMGLSRAHRVTGPCLRLDLSRRE